MNIELYLSKLQPGDRFIYNKFGFNYKNGSNKYRRGYLYTSTRDAQNEKYTYREVLKLISI